MAVFIKPLRTFLHASGRFGHNIPTITKPLGVSAVLSDTSRNELSKKFSFSSRRSGTCQFTNKAHEQEYDTRSKLFYGLLFIPVSLKSFFGADEEHRETPEEILTNHIKRSILLIRKGDLLTAERLLHVALKLAQEQQNQDGITYVYDVLANLAFDKEEYSKAEKLFVTVLQRLLTAGTPQDDLKVVHISLKLAKVYEVSNDLQKCEQGFIFCLDTLRKRMAAGAKDEDTLLLWAMTLDWYARYLLQVNRANEALENLKTAYNVVVQVSGPNHEQAVVLLNDLGTASSIAGDQASAALYLEQAINVAKGLEETPEIASIMVNLGVVHLRKGTYQEAKHWCTMGQRQATKEKSDESFKEGKECLEELKKVLMTSS